MNRNNSNFRSNNRQQNPRNDRNDNRRGQNQRGQRNQNQRDRGGMRVGLNWFAPVFEKFDTATATKRLFPTMSVFYRQFVGYNEEQRAEYADSVFISVGVPFGRIEEIDDALLAQVVKFSLNHMHLPADTQYQVYYGEYALTESVEEALAAEAVAPAYVITGKVEDARGFERDYVQSVKLFGNAQLTAQPKENELVVYDGDQPVTEIKFTVPFTAPANLQAERKQERIERQQARREEFEQRAQARVRRHS